MPAHRFRHVLVTILVALSLSLPAAAAAGPANDDPAAPAVLPAEPMPARTDAPGLAGPPTLRAWVPLTPSGRWQRYWEKTFLSPGAYFRALGAATGGQFANDPVEWGQGGAGYARRTMSTFARFTVADTIRQSTAAALGYDPRYLRCGCSGGWRRLGHALTMSVLTVDAQGRLRPDIPAFAGAYGAAAVSASWLPGPTHPVRDGSRQLGFQVGINVLQEFGPELKGLFGFGG